MKFFFKHLSIAFLATTCLTILFTLEKKFTGLNFIHYFFGIGGYVFIFYLFNVYAKRIALSLENEVNIKPTFFWLFYTFVIVSLNLGIAYVLTFALGSEKFGNFEGRITSNKFFIDSFVISLTIGLFFYTYYFIKSFYEKKSTKQEQKTLEITQNHEALKSQIGPHFLFNSLNVLSGLVEENPTKAQDFIADLAEVYRYVLDQKDKDWVTVVEEIVFAEKYLLLMKSRFEKGLNVEIDSKLANSTQFIAPLTLQLLLENALKHNKISEAEPLEIRLEEKDGYLMVANNFNPKKNLEKREGKGLQQIQKRYESIGQKIRIE